ncbi:ComF family protein [Clostridium sp.]|uniref:ComF family protein n=1 Tax=Clostridium sp. TaxID=1506 RepID=UPI002FC65A23
MGRRFITFISYILNSIVGLIYCGMEKCIICDAEVEEDYICPSCNSSMKISYLSYNLKQNDEEYKCFSLGYYSYSIKKLVLALKYKKNFSAGLVIAKYLSDFLKNEFKDEFDILTFVPSSKESLQKRGFNQCEVVCKNISKDINRKCISLLKKVKFSRDQIGLTTNERWDNIKDSFSCINSKLVEGKNILLIDDVVTTGATAFYCASTLKRAGAKDVYILTVAKSRV